MIEKQEEIEKGNSILLRKLVEIQTSKKKVSMVRLMEKHITGSQSASVIPDTLRSKSLHFNARKLEQERIDRENLKIANQIFNL